MSEAPKVSPSNAEGPTELRTPARRGVPFRSALKALPFLLRNPSVIPWVLRSSFPEALLDHLIRVGEEDLGSDQTSPPSAPSPQELARWEADRQVLRTRAGTYGGHYYLLLYRTVRRLRPRIVVETGVASGRSTALILSAFERNGEAAHLYSADLPFQGYRTDQGRRTQNKAVLGEFAAFVPKRWRPPPEGDPKAPWTLMLGDTRKTLPALLDQLGWVDLFFHDSAHTSEVMGFEYREAWPHLPPGGALASDDIGWNDAFPDFLRSVKVEGYQGSRFALAVKPR